MSSLKLVRNVCLPFSARNFYCISHILNMQKRILKKISASGTFLNIFLKFKDIFDKRGIERSILTKNSYRLGRFG